jgi:glutamine synthetase
MSVGDAAGMLTAADLTADRFDTIVVAAPDVHGRLFGRRIPLRKFLQAGGLDGYRLPICTCVLAWDIAQDMGAEVPFAGLHTGWHDFVLHPDAATLRPYPGAERTAVVMADVHTEHGEPVEIAPRWILRRQVDRARAAGYQVLLGSELEFYLFEGSPRDARANGFRELRPTTLIRSDYSIVGQGVQEPFIARIRGTMDAAGIPIDACQAEYGLGQWEVNLEHSDALETADRHGLYKAGVKELALQAGLSATFMAKPSAADMGSSCHLHVSLVSIDTGEPAFPSGPGPHDLSDLMRSFMGGLLEHLAETALFFAPSVNSYKRYTGDLTVAGGPIVWGYDNRTATLRVVGHGPSLRAEHRFAGADVNPYLAAAALIAAGLDGVERGLDPGQAFVGDAYARGDLPTAPRSLGEALAAFDASGFVASAFGKDVVEHYAPLARADWDAYTRAAVTDWEIGRAFEQA